MSVNVKVPGTVCIAKWFLFLFYVYNIRGTVLSDVPLILLPEYSPENEPNFLLANAVAYWHLKDAHGYYNLTGPLAPIILHQVLNEIGQFLFCFLN